MTAQTFELNHCYNMDCMEAMAAFPNDYFDLAVVDPPYFSGPERRGFYGSKVSRIGVHRDYPVSPAWEVPGKEYFDELTRVSRHYILYGAATISAMDLLRGVSYGISVIKQRAFQTARSRQRTYSRRLDCSAICGAG